MFSERFFRSSTASLAIVLLASCGGGGGGGSPGFLPVLPQPPAAANYTVGGTVVGLVGTLVLQNNAGDDLKLTANGKFSFSTSLAKDGAYHVKVRTQPIWQFCTVTSGAGKVMTDVDDVVVACSAAAAQVSTLAGIANSNASADGDRTVATFASPGRISIDKNGSLLVTDLFLVRRVLTNGDVATFAGSGAVGSVNSNGPAASFDGVIDIAVAPSGDAYVSEFSGNRIRRITPTADVSTFAGSGNTATTDGLGTLADFSHPNGIAVDAAGYIYVAETTGHAIRKISPAGDVVSFAGSGSGQFADGTGGGASFNRPAGIAVDADGNLFVADHHNHRIRKITPVGVVTTFAGSGSPGAQDGPASIASFNGPNGVAVDADSNVYVADSGNALLRRITPTGMVTTLAGQLGVFGAQNGIGAEATFDTPIGIAIDAAGSLYVSDSGNKLVRKVTPTQSPY